MPALDLSRDYLKVHDPITVAVRRKPDEGEAAVEIATVDYVQKGGVTREDLERNPRWIVMNTSVFHLWKARCPSGFLPRMSDVVVHGSEAWLVEGIGFLDRDANGVQRYRLIAVKSTT